MKSSQLKYLLILVALTLFPLLTAQAQDYQERPPGERPPVRPPRLLEQLNLSREQIQQIRRINQEKQPQIRAAQEKLRDANRALDMAIYADNPNEEEIKNRLKEVQNAQAEVIRLRTSLELEVRKVLTAEQIAKFRQLREEFEKEMEERRQENENRRNRQDRPNMRPRPNNRF